MGYVEKVRRDAVLRGDVERKKESRSASVRAVGVWGFRAGEDECCFVLEVRVQMAAGTIASQNPFAIRKKCSRLLRESERQIG